jgi:hypothetical protein
MGRIPKTSSSDVAGDDLRAETDQIERLLARLRRTADHAAIDGSLRTAGSTLAKRYAAFTPSGDVSADRASLAELEQQATSLLRKARKQEHDHGARRGARTAGAGLGCS